MTMRRKIALGLGALLVAVIVAVAAVAGYAWWEARSAVALLRAGPKAKIVAAVEPELQVKPKRMLVPAPPEPGAQTILLIGSDRRPAGQGQVGARSDTTILMRLDPRRHRLALLSIPRDLYVDIPGRGHDRINMAYEWGGEKLLTKTVRETLGVRIDHFVEIDFHGFRKLVEDLGGIWLPVDQRYYNRNVGTVGTNYASIDLQPGYQKLNGTQALAFARYRHDDSDLYRAARQQLVIREVIRQTFKRRLDFFRTLHLARDFAAATTSDIHSVRTLWGLANAVRTAHIERVTIEGADMVLYGAAYLNADPTQLKTAVRKLLGVRPARAPGRTTTAAPQRASAPAALASDGGRAQAFLAPLVPGMRRCVPTALPPGYSWPYENAARRYAIDGHPAIALYATAGSGRSLLWTFTTWRDPPVLARPTRVVHVHGRSVELFADSGGVRQVAWNVGPTRVWLTNTLRNEVTNTQLLALVASCRGDRP